MLQRGNVVIGWQQKDRVEPITPPSGQLHYVHDRIHKVFVELSADEMQILGCPRCLDLFGRLIYFVLAVSMGTLRNLMDISVNLESIKHTITPSNKQTFKPALKHTR